MADDPGEAGNRLDWRRPLWKELYPRFRHESSPEDAARIVVRNLRGRVTVVIRVDEAVFTLSFLRNSVRTTVQ